MKDYIVVTPCKNEEDNIIQLADSIINQTIQPKLWVIIDDGSTDSTPQLLKTLTLMCNWIYVSTLQSGKRDLSFHYAEVVNNGLTLALNISKEYLISYSYVGLIDADMILPPYFFEKMITKFEGNPNLGVASGAVVYEKGEKKVLEKGRNNLPIGGLRVWKHECFVSTGGFPISYSADSVSNVLATLQGWDIAIFEDIQATQTRETSSAEGLWNGYLTRGKSDYYRDYHPIYVIFKCLKYTFRYPFYVGLPYFCGYINGITRIKRKIENKEVRNYYRNKHKEIIEYYGNKFSSFR